jgi:hypothetical protein
LECDHHTSTRYIKDHHVQISHSYLLFIAQKQHTQQLLGINIFTYILAALIVFFLSMNAVFGVGWLGQSLGWENVGTFTKVSESLPLDVDVSSSDYLLQ